MTFDREKYLLVIVGPTAVGKTALAIELAQKFNAEIVSADSRQFYRELNVGTAKPTEEELASATHHLVNSLSVSDDYSAGRFETDALECLMAIYKKSDYAILCGGSGLYIDLVCRSGDNMPPANHELREKLKRLLEEKGIGVLQSMLQDLDPEYFNSADIRNPQRLVRALEVCQQTGKKYSELRTGKSDPRPFEIIKIGLENDRAEVYRRIDARVDAMMKNNLLFEARQFYEKRRLNALRTVGYKELFDFMDGKTSLEKAVSLIKQHSRNYAKRQWTWFRKDADIRWFRPGEIKDIVDYIRGRIQTGMEEGG